MRERRLGLQDRPLGLDMRPIRIGAARNRFGDRWGGCRMPGAHVTIGAGGRVARVGPLAHRRIRARLTPLAGDRVRWPWCLSNRFLGEREIGRHGSLGLGLGKFRPIGVSSLRESRIRGRRSRGRRVAAERLTRRSSRPGHGAGGRDSRGRGPGFARAQHGRPGRKAGGLLAGRLTPRPVPGQSHEFLTHGWPHIDHRCQGDRDHQQRGV